ncbi:MFS transporter [Desulfotalea psychrophila]|uniref:Related to quinolone resistance protein (NorA) n=1 Tax=Desulfotalea psychrophila (strain LSv54 / DSM 12343) TaxID=177439 RepID=Q6AJB3_DESPS|nr:MFS transporter [Desulfotalea psychrophila]CAG37567.1 related to quinolone resistance protein (NorA) [Desulfotalea psychrophila LSv54]
MPGRTLITLLLSIFIALLGIGIIVPVMPIYAETLGAGGFALGMIIASFSVSRCILQPIIGNLSDSLGRKRFLIAGLLIYALVGLLIPEAESIQSLIFIRLLHGMGSAMIVPIAMAYVSQMAPYGHEGRYMSFLNIAIFSGMGCGPIIGGIFFDTLGFKAVFYMMAAMSFLAAILITANLPNREETKSIKLQASLLSSMKRMVANRHTRGVLITRYATMTALVPSMAFLPFIMTESGYSSGTLVGLVIACRTLVNAALQFPCGKLADRYNKLTLLFIGVWVMVIATSLIPEAEKITSFFLIYALLGCGEAIVWPTLAAYASLDGRENYGHGTMMGVFNLAMSGGVFTGALLAGYSMDSIGLRWAFYIPAITIATIASLGMALIYRAERQRSEALISTQGDKVHK